MYVMLGGVCVGGYYLVRTQANAPHTASYCTGIIHPSSKITDHVMTVTDIY